MKYVIPVLYMFYFEILYFDIYLIYTLQSSILLIFALNFKGVL